MSFRATPRPTNKFDEGPRFGRLARTVKPFSGGGVDSASLYQATNRLNSGESSWGRDCAHVTPAFGGAQPFSGESGFYGGVDIQRGRDSDDANNNAFTRHERTRHISDNSSINKFYRGFGDNTMPERQRSDIVRAHELRGCPETNMRLLEEYGRDGQFRSPPQFFANIPLQTSRGINNSRSQCFDDADLLDFETLSLAPRDRFYSAPAVHRAR